MPRHSSVSKQQLGTVNSDQSVPFDVDVLGIDGFTYDPEWTLKHPIMSLVGPSLSRVTVCAPLGTDFKIFIVLGWNDEGAPHMDITLSRNIADGLAGQLETSRIVELKNTELWSPLREDPVTASGVAQKSKTTLIARKGKTKPVRARTSLTIRPVWQRTRPPKESMSPELVERLILRSRWKTVNNFALQFGLSASSLYKFIRKESADIRTGTRVKLAVAFPSFTDVFGYDACTIRPFKELVAEQRTKLAAKKSS